MRKSIFAALLLALAGFGISAVAAPNTIKFGDNRAFLFPDGRLMIPVNVTNDSATGAIGWVITISTSGQPLHPDSAIFAGRTPHTFMLNQFSRAATNPAPQAYDTACFLIVTGTPSNGCIPEGSGTVAQAWLTGGAVGDIIHIAALPDGSYGGPEGGCTFDSVHAVTCRNAGTQDYSFIASDLVIAPVTVEFTCPNLVNTMSALPLDIPVTLTGFSAPYGLSVLEFTGPNGPVPFPAITGSNPFHVNWTPPLVSAGTYKLLLWGNDSTNQGTQFLVTIVVANSKLQGDATCDSIVDLSDLSRIAAYLTGSGPAPVCPGP
ncbi:MAG: hypothetical protein WAU88_00720 [Candidatus Zixiibacteriota bacterium]